MIRKTDRKSLDVIGKEWDELCEARQTAIQHGQDVSLVSVTAPCIIRNVIAEAPERVLDIGCGTGYLTAQVAKLIGHCLGIDISKKSLEIAQASYADVDVQFIHASINSFYPSTTFDLCLSNMVLSSDPCWRDSIKKTYSILDKNGCFFIMIPHPSFWPQYWNFSDKSWFNYNDEIFIEHDFSISLVPNIGKSTFIHRPLSGYINELVSAGFSIERIEEPYPITEFPEGYSYQYPRFLFIKCRKNN